MRLDQPSALLIVCMLTLLGVINSAFGQSTQVPAKSSFKQTRQELSQFQKATLQTLELIKAGQLTATQFQGTTSQSMKNLVNALNSVLERVQSLESEMERLRSSLLPPITDSELNVKEGHGRTPE